MRRTALLLVLSLALSACFPRGIGLLAAVAGTAIVTAAIVSSRPPPPPRVVFVPAPRPGYAWQPGYWTLQDQEWIWVEGQWVALRSGYRWSPAHWEQQPDGNWALFPGQWEPME